MMKRKVKRSLSSHSLTQRHNHDRADASGGAPTVSVTVSQILIQASETHNKCLTINVYVSLFILQ